jgi:hypothetical protein
MVSRARLDVDAHHQKRGVMALTYAPETADRDLVASDLAWRTWDMVQGSTVRWLVEVFFADWQVQAGWGPLTTPPDEDGSSRRLILSRRLDHGRLLHPHPLARLEHQRPAYTVGSLHQRTRVDSLLAFIRELILADHPGEPFHRLSQAVEEVFQWAPSKKHLNNRDLGKLEPTPPLTYRVEMAEVSVWRTELCRARFLGSPWGIPSVSQEAEFM